MSLKSVPLRLEVTYPVRYIVFLPPEGYILDLYPEGDFNELRLTHTQTARASTQRTAEVAKTHAKRRRSSRRAPAQNRVETGARHRNRNDRKPLQAALRAAIGARGPIEIASIANPGVVARAAPLENPAPYRLDERGEGR